MLALSTKIFCFHTLEQNGIEEQKTSSYPQYDVSYPSQLQNSLHILGRHTCYLNLFNQLVAISYL